MMTVTRFLTVCVLVVVLPVHLPAQEESVGNGFGARVGWGFSGSPHGNIAERHGTFLVPGKDYEVAFHFRLASGKELSLGLLSDGYDINQELDRQTGSRFEYNSTGVFAGFAMTEQVGLVPIRLGMDAGWRWYSVESRRPNYYTSEPGESSMKGRTAALGLSAGIEIPFEFATAVPRIRVETNYPSFGGGDGYTDLRQVSDLAFRASLGVGLKYDFKKTK